MLMSALNEKFCFPTGKYQKFCNRMHPSQFLGLFFFVLITSIMRYVIPILFGLYIFPDAGINMVGLPFANYIVYLPYYDYIVPTTIDTIWLIISIVLCMAYIFYLFYTIGFYALIPVILSLVPSLITIFYAPFVFVVFIFGWAPLEVLTILLFWRGHAMKNKTDYDALSIKKEEK